MYKITCTYDNDKAPKWTGQYSDALEAFEEFAKFKDWGFADEFATINLSLPDGKMYTKRFYRSGKKDEK
jgi:hypothetical protein